MKGDASLLRQYTETGDESAFVELVRCHADLVFGRPSAALVARRISQRTSRSKSSPHWLGRGIRRPDIRCREPSSTRRLEMPHSIL